VFLFLFFEHTSTLSVFERTAMIRRRRRQAGSVLERRLCSSLMRRRMKSEYEQTPESFDLTASTVGMESSETSSIYSEVFESMVSPVRDEMNSAQKAFDKVNALIRHRSKALDKVRRGGRRNLTCHFLMLMLVCVCAIFRCNS